MHSLGFTEEQLGDYLDSALCDAVVYCIVNGIDPDMMETCTVRGFGIMYRSLRRIEAQRTLDTVSALRVSVWADKKEYISYLEGVCVWLHEVNRATVLKSPAKGAHTAGINELLKDFKGHVKHG